MKNKKLNLAILATLTVFLLIFSTGCDDDDTSAGMIPMEPNIVETAAADGNFNTLVAAVEAADLVDTLSGPGPFTVFAPTDAAFAKLPAGVLSDLLLPQNKGTLESILLYHVVPGENFASDVVTRSGLTTALGQDVTIAVNNGEVFVNQSQIVQTDIRTSNGVIHVIDAVLLP